MLAQAQARTPRRTRRSARRPVAGAGLTALVLAGLALAGCSGSSTHSSSSGGSVNSGVAANGAAKAAPGIAAPAGIPAAAPSATPLQQRDIIRTANLDVTVSDVDAAAGAASSAALAAGGRVDGDDRTADPAGRHAELTLRVPPARLDGLIADAVRLGHENSRSEHGQDVTAAQADVTARVHALTISVERLRDFLKHSGSIGDLVSLESQLTQRESELESTIAQQRALGDQVGLATLTLTLTTHRAGPASARTGPAGFGSALLGALGGLLLTLRWLAALAGYLLPFAFVLAVPALLLIRWLRRRSAGTPVRLEPPADPVLG